MLDVHAGKIAIVILLSNKQVKIQNKNGLTKYTDRKICFEFVK